MPVPLSRCDVLVIGGGVAALSAAIAARNAGASVRVLEKAPSDMRGGDARHARNVRVVHDVPTPFAPGYYREAEFLDELQGIAKGQSNATLAQVLARQSAALPDWMAAHGVRFQKVSGGGLPVSRRTMFFLGGGKAMLNALYATARRMGVDIRYEIEVTGMRLDGARVRTVEIRDGNGPQTIQARAVIACSGGYQADLDRLGRVWGDAAGQFIVRGSPFATGEVLHDLMDQGVAPSGVPGACHLVAVDARSPQFDGGIVTRALDIPSGIVVDRNGQRFHDEASVVGPSRYAVWGRLLARCPGQIAYLILDTDACGQMHPSVFPPLGAATIAELAALAGLDPSSLQATVSNFNAAIKIPESGKIPEFGLASHNGETEGLSPPKTRQARPIARPPFTVIPMRAGVTFTCHGVQVDAQARVLLTDGRPIENLFAAGVIMAPNILGSGYLAGVSITIACVFGIIAGAEAARMAGSEYQPA